MIYVFCFTTCWKFRSSIRVKIVLIFQLSQTLLITYRINSFLLSSKMLKLLLTHLFKCQLANLTSCVKPRWNQSCTRKTNSSSFCLTVSVWNVTTLHLLVYFYMTYNNLEYFRCISIFREKKTSKLNCNVENKYSRVSLNMKRCHGSLQSMIKHSLPSWFC